MGEPSDTIHATGVPDSLDVETLKAAFEPYGEIKTCKLIKGLPGNMAAMIQFGTVEEATFCVDNLNEQILFEDCGLTHIKFSSKQQPQIAKPVVKIPVKPVAKPALAKPAVAKPAVAKPAFVKPAVAKPAGAAPVGVVSAQPGVKPGLIKSTPLRSAASAESGVVRPGLIKATPLKGKAVAVSAAKPVVRPAALVQAATIKPVAQLAFKPVAQVPKAASARVSPYGAAPGVVDMRGGYGAVKAATAGAVVSAASLKKELQASGRLLGGGNKEWDPAGELFVGSLPPDMTDQDMYEIFSTFGAIPVRGVKAMKLKDGVGTGVGYVNFINPAHAQLAISYLNGHMMPNGKTLQVRLKTDRA